MSRRQLTSYEWDNIDRESMEILKKSSVYLWFKEIIESEENVPENWNLDLWMEARGISFSYDILREMQALRNVYTRKYGFVIITKKLIRSMVKHIIKGGKVLEVMCGTGYMSMALRQEGVDIIPTDNLTWPAFEDGKKWVEIEDLDAVEAVHKYAADVDFVLMSWPPYAEGIGTDVVLAMKEEIKKLGKSITLILIGEGPGGCTGDDDLWCEVTDYLDDETADIVNENFASFNGIHDQIYVADFDPIAHEHRLFGRR